MATGKNTALAQAQTLTAPVTVNGKLEAAENVYRFHARKGEKLVFEVNANRLGTPLDSLIAHEDTILKLAYSPDGKLLASSGADRTIKIFKADDLTEVKTLDHQPDWVMSLAFSPDGKTFAAGRYDGSLEIYNVGQLSSAPARQARTLAPNAIH